MINYCGCIKDWRTFNFSFAYFQFNTNILTTIDAGILFSFDNIMKEGKKNWPIEPEVIYHHLILRN